MKAILEQLFQYQQLSYDQARDVLIRITAGQYNQPQIAAFMTAFIMRPPAVEELSGFRDALLGLCIPLKLTSEPAIDLCGTGGDGKNTFNISTLTAFVVAGAGQKVIKHGNYGVSSVSGSSNVLEALGYRFTNKESQLQKELDLAGICFLHAPLFHPSMKTVAPVRSALGVKTFFNMLGPLVNPAKPTYQLSGVFNLEIARKYQYIFQRGEQEATIVYSLDGYDECTLTAETRVLKTNQEFWLSPSDFGLSENQPTAIIGGNNSAEAAQLFLTILKGQGTEAQQNTVIANAALALQHFHNESLIDSVARARESLQDKKAFQIFKKLLEINL
ncbi:MAG: anthranilate phosphoribosyltransferase [Bacteroidetes bacterium]|jgi:anthranilate phosphoribosyltransferase|nr:anthranilate phosphoribosyltransferase [Bacteroidota bacterium]